jgi:hypothetical protein
VAHERELGFLAAALAVEPRVRVRARGVGVVRPALAMKIPLAVPAGTGRRARTVLRLEALRAGPGFDERAVHREVLARQQPLHPALRQHRRKELRRDIAIEQPVAVLGERRGIPNRLVDAQPDEPTEQKVVLDPLDQLTLRPDRVKRLKQQGPDKPLRRNRLPTKRRVQRIKVGG